MRRCHHRESGVARMRQAIRAGLRRLQRNHRGARGLQCLGSRRIVGPFKPNLGAPLQQNAGNEVEGVMVALGDQYLPSGAADAARLRGILASERIAATRVDAQWLKSETSSVDWHVRHRVASAIPNFLKLDLS